MKVPPRSLVTESSPRPPVKVPPVRLLVTESLSAPPLKVPKFNGRVCPLHAIPGLGLNQLHALVRLALSDSTGGRATSAVR